MKIFSNVYTKNVFIVDNVNNVNFCITKIHSQHLVLRAHHLKSFLNLLHLYLFSFSFSPSLFYFCPFSLSSSFLHHPKIMLFVKGKEHKDYWYLKIKENHIVHKFFHNNYVQYLVVLNNNSLFVKYRWSWLLPWCLLELSVFNILELLTVNHIIH